MIVGELHGPRGVRVKGAYNAVGSDRHGQILPPPESIGSSDHHGCGTNPAATTSLLLRAQFGSVLRSGRLSRRVLLAIAGSIRCALSAPEPARSGTASVVVE